jgi:hypothetical protein
MSMTMARSVNTASPAKHSQSKIRGNFPQPSIISEQRVNRKEDRSRRKTIVPIAIPAIRPAGRRDADFDSANRTDLLSNV